MDIVSRLKEFLDTFGISNSTFADSCSIPRPTVSQLLNGRNKKVSDEIISKIHQTYPSLSMLWLLFGEGNMVDNSNIENIRAKLSDKTEPKQSQNIDFKRLEISDDEFESSQEKSQNLANDQMFTYMVSGENDFYEGKRGNVAGPSENSTQAISNTAPKHTVPSQPASVRIQADPHKRITNIVVFYSDNSFQSFEPSKE